MLSRHTFGGRRKGFRRGPDQENGGYVDRYSASLLFFLILIAGLNILDSLFTMIILDHGGTEANPLVRSAIEVYGRHFWAWKFSIVSLNLILLCLHSWFRYVRKIVMGLAFVYLAIVLYQIVLISVR
jgi:hypothetical protein